MILIAVLYAVFAGMTFINSKLMLTNPYPFFVGMLRAFGSALFLIAYGWMRHKKQVKNFSLPKTGWKRLITFGVCVHGFAMSGFSYSVQYADPVKVCFIIALCPFITAILQYLLNNEILTPRKVTGLFIGFLGLIPILLAADHGAYAEVPHHLEVLGGVVCFIATTFFAYGWIEMKKFLNDFSYPIEIVNSIAMFIGGGVSFALFLISTNFSFADITLSSEFPMIMSAFMVSSLATYLLYAYLLKTFSATFIAFAGFLEPVFGLVYGVVFMGHPLGAGSVGALFVLFFGLYIFYKEEIKTHNCDVTTDPNC